MHIIIYIEIKFSEEGQHYESQDHNQIFLNLQTTQKRKQQSFNSPILMIQRDPYKSGMMSCEYCTVYTKE